MNRSGMSAVGRIELIDYFFLYFAKYWLDYLLGLIYEDLFIRKEFLK